MNKIIQGRDFANSGSGYGADENDYGSHVAYHTRRCDGLGMRVLHMTPPCMITGR